MKTPLERARARYTEARDAFARASTALDAISDDASDEDRNAAISAADETRAAATTAKAELDTLEKIERAKADLKPVAADVIATLLAGDIVVGREEDVYREDRGGFFLDLALAREHSPEAIERLHRNNKMQIGLREERRRAGKEVRAISQTATAGGEFIPPIWLADYAPKLRAGRAFLNALGTRPLPGKTNSINLPAITTGSTAAVQTDGGAPSNTDLVTAALTAQVQTVAGRSVASYQLVDLSQPGIDQVIYDDSLAAYNQAEDAAAISGAVTNAKGVLNVTGINAITYTDASPTVPELYTPIFQAKSSIEKGAFLGVDFALVHPSTWNWMLAGLDTANRPLATSFDATSFNRMAGFDWAAEGLVGNFNGVPVIGDANLPVNLGAGTNESRIVLVNRRGFDVWEGEPTFKVAEQTNLNNLQYLFVLYGYYAAMSRQPKAISVVSGTGLIVQSGF